MSYTLSDHYNSLKRLMTEDDSNIEYTQKNSKNDDGTVLISHMFDEVGFKFDNDTVKYVQGTGNSQIYFDKKSKGLFVNNRDGAMYWFGFQEGTVGNGILYNYFRIRFKGYSYYSSTDNAHLIEYDVVGLSTGDLYLKIYHWPTSDNNGTNKLIMTNGELAFSPSADNLEFTFRHQDDQGTVFTVENGIIEPKYADVRYLFGDGTNIYKWQAKDGTNGIGELVQTSSAISASTFQNEGTYVIPDVSLFKDFPKVQIYKWQDVGTAEQRLQVKATPNAQEVTATCNMSSPTIKSIVSINYTASDDVTVSYSFDNATWSEAKALKGLTVNDLLNWHDTKTIYFKFTLNTLDSYITSFKLNFSNT